MQKANDDIRAMIAQHRLRQWEVADVVGISDSRFTVWLRTPLNDDRKKRVLAAIKQLTAKTSV
ncbi:hypothetical protein [Schleiferilactobacillus harbinensis]|uniref:hypothetical protein n=1 Tax=Schleiferilactobacillus harbinensis TaxID=304207 RepID=UPI001169777D|nr:hypothetical protein [Schleiferilactobacillus harbinensis]GEK06740.1 hypothetical protein LHA01_19790 [Schleiferilactobacillus harbinensis]